ncbi:hypothetical protein RIF29_20254 [Crotalaria pallida]|uniref:Uncharacterized protein n=1 Tax=Crotalaria pallida TaxID=3830 RepID=A0AAN9F274_CROPI
MLEDRQARTTPLIPTHQDDICVLPCTNAVHVDKGQVQIESTKKEFLHGMTRKDLGICSQFTISHHKLGHALSQEPRAMFPGHPLSNTRTWNSSMMAQWTYKIISKAKLAIIFQDGMASTMC